MPPLYAGSIPAHASKFLKRFTTPLFSRLPYGKIKTMKRTWKLEQLIEGVRTSTSFRQVLGKLGLREAGGNYIQLKKYVRDNNLDTSHFRGKAWNKGLRIFVRPRFPLEQILKEKTEFPTFKLKLRLWKAGLKPRYCEECGWAQETKDGYLPLELDHISGDHMDNRLENLRILCPNCHSLKPTHRGRNKKKKVVYV